MRSCLNILFNGTVEEVSDFLPIELAKIQRISKTCKDASKTAVEKFSTVMNTMQEMHESTVVKEGLLKEQTSQTAADLELAQKEEKRYENEEENMNHLKMQIEKELKEKNEEYKKAYDSMPGAWGMAGLAFAETACKVAPILAMAGAGSMILGAATAAETGALAGMGTAAILGNQVKGVLKDKVQTQTQQDSSTHVAMNEADRSLYGYATDLSNQPAAGIDAIFIPTGGAAMNFKLAWASEGECGLSCDDIKKKINALNKRIEENKARASNALYEKLRMSRNVQIR